MSAIGYLSAFRLYGWDVLLLAGGVSLLTTLLKKTVLKHVSGKVYVFIPFALGILLFAAYRALATLSAEPFTTGIAATLEGGFACGCAATLYYAVYKQFFGQGADGSAQKRSAPVAPLLEGFVPDEALDATAEALLTGAAGKTGEALRAFVLETLRAAAPAATEAETEALAALVANFLAVLQKAAPDAAADTTGKDA